MNRTNHQLRLVIDPPLAGAHNMAVDEAILNSVNDHTAPPTLRFYQWDQPTISLGYFQKFAEVADQHSDVARLPVVRRQTGGGAILHDDELTYSLVLPLDLGNQHTDIEKLYGIVHDSFIQSLAWFGINAEYRGGDDRGNAQRGPFFCFARTHRLDLVVGPDKLLGSAQRRMKNAVLQHGSLIIRRHFPQQPAAEAAQIAEQSKNFFDLDKLIELTAQQIAAQLKLALEIAPLTALEKALAQQFEDKYNGEDWTEQR
ncbi:MAG: lipoate--protein ligase family protein [Sedimentisphaerales bacterium]|nr:lipoate--protein ligase family protein [Sedimentisphaerales bacterium]